MIPFSLSYFTAPLLSDRVPQSPEVEAIKQKEEYAQAPPAYQPNAYPQGKLVFLPNCQKNQKLLF